MRFIRNIIAGLMLSSCTPSLDYLLGRDAGHEQTDVGSDSQGDVGGDSTSNIDYDVHSDIKKSDLGRDSYHPDAAGDVRADSPHDGGIDAPPDQGILDGHVRADIGSDSLGVDLRITDGQSPDRLLYDGLSVDGGYSDGLFSDAYLTDTLPDVGYDASLCSGAAPFNSNQEGVCRGSLQRCSDGQWQNDYTLVSGYESLETLCDGFDNDCDARIDEDLIPPSRTCSAGVGECRREGLEYLTCLGSAGWSTTYSGCDAIAGIPTAEVCNRFDDNCNGVTDEVILDDFNRADQNGLGNNELGNVWANYGTADDWDVEGNAAVTTWRGGPLTNPQASSYVGHRSTFNLLVKFNLDSVTQIGGGGIPRLGVNCSEGSLDGFLAKIGVGGSRHTIVRDGVDLGEASFPLQANTDYLVRFAYDGADLSLKLWQDGTAEPVNVLLRRPTTDVPLTKEYLTISGDLDSSQVNAVTVDYIYDHCEN